MSLWRKILSLAKWPLLVLVALNIESLALALGIDDLVVTYFDAPQSVSFLFTPVATYIYLLMLSFLFGLGIDGAIRGISRAKSQKLSDFGSELIALSSKIDTNIENANKADEPLENVFGEILSKGKTLVTKYRIRPYITSKNSKLEEVEYAKIISFQFRTVGYLLKDEHINTARRVVKRHNEDIAQDLALKIKSVDIESAKAISQEGQAKLPSS